MRYSSRWRLRDALLALVGLCVARCSLDERLLLEARADAGSIGTGSTTAGGASGAGAFGRGGTSGAGVLRGTGGQASADASADTGSAGAAEGGASNAGGSGANSAGNGGSGAIDGGAGTGGAGSSGTGGITGVGGCGDLDKNGVADCMETLVRNSRFDANANDWAPEPALEQRWDPRDSSGGSDSGALSILNANKIDTSQIGLTMVGSSQCVEVVRLRKYTLAAQLLIPSRQGDGYAGINVFLYADPGCTGTFLHGYTPVLVDGPGVWHSVSGEIETSPGTRSMLVRLVASKPFAQPSFQVLFDNVLVHSE